MPSDLIDFSDPKFTYHKLFGVKNKLYHHIHHPHLVFYSVFECVLFGVFAILPFLIGFSFKNDLKSFLDPKLIVDNPALQNDDSYTVQQKDGKYQITIDLVYKEAHYYLFDFNQFLDSNHRPLTDNEYDFFYEPSLINKNNHTIVTATSGVKWENKLKTFTIGVNDGGQMYYPQVNNYLFSIDFTINAKGFKTYANQIQVALNIGPSHLNHSFYINEPAIEGTTINATDIVNEQLTLNETGLTSDVINFSKEWSLINASNYIYTSAMGYESSIVVNDSGQLIITKIPAGNRSIIVQCIVRSQNYLFVPQTIQRTIDFWVEGDFGVYECEETPIVYTYGTTQLYNGGVSIIKTNRLKAIDPNLNAADGYIPKANYEDSLDISMSTPGLSGIIDYDLAERKITISNSINAGTYQLAFKYRYYDGYGSYYPYDYPNYAYEIVTITINRGTIIAPSLKINGTTTSGIAVDYDYSSSSYLLTTTYGDSYTNPNNNSQIDSISTSWDFTTLDTHYFSTDAIPNKFHMKQDATLPVGSNQINDLPVTISSNNYYDLITTFDIDIAVSKAAFVDYQVLIDGSDQLMIQTDYLTTEFLLELDGTLPAYLLTNPARHDGNLPSGTNLFYEITESSDPTRISIVGSGLNTRIKILPGFLHTDDISFKVKCTLSNSNYVDKTTSLTTFILKIYPPGGIWYRSGGDVLQFPMPYNSTNITALTNTSSANNSKTFYDGYTFLTINRFDILDISFDHSWDTFTEAPAYFMTYYFSGIDNNEIANGVENYSYLNLPKKITKVGDGFLGGMFAYNKSLKTLSPYFNIPQLINDVGAQFLTGMFGGCEFLEALPDDFNLPQNIVDLDATDIEFCTQMFDETYELKLLPRNFNIPQGIWAAPRKFLEKLFFVSGIELLPAGFRFPNITRLYQDDAMRQMFYGCDNLDYLPEYFDLPQNFVADNSIVYGVFDGMFYGFDANPRYGPNFSFDQEPLTPANSFTVPIPNDYANRAYVRYAGQIFGPYNYTPTDGVAFAITRRSGSSN